MSRLEEIKARAEAATPGPWQWREDEPASLVHVTDPRLHPWNVLKAPDWGPTLADAAFIAAAREDVPWLLAEVERLTAERDALIAVGKRQAARLARVEALAEEWDGDDSCDNRTCVPHRSADALRAALSGSEADTTDTQPTEQETDQ